MQDKLNEKAPPGWSGTVKAMKKHKNIDNPFALAWYMKKKGDKPHYQPEKKGEKPKRKKKYESEDKKDCKMESFGDYVARRELNEGKKKEKWISDAVDEKHKGFCTPMTKKTCTPRRKALAKRFKKGGDLYSGD